MSFWRNERSRYWRFLMGALAILVVAAACTAQVDEPAAGDEESQSGQVEPTPTVASEPQTAEPESTAGQTAEAEATADTTSSAAGGEEKVEIRTEDNRPEFLRRATSSWDTNWNRHIISYEELLSGGPPRDGIPSIDDPSFVTPEEATEWLADNEPVVSLEIAGDARAYPLQILTWHEIANDEVGGLPVVVTFCPLCNSAITFERTVDDQVLEFGVSGLLRNSDLVMYDRTTESLWQQLTGRAIVGDMVPRQLSFVPSSIVSFADFRSAHPEGMVLSRDTGYNRRYGQNPYVGYDNIEQSPFLFRGPTDGRLPAMARVAAVEVDGTDIAYPFSVLEEVGVVNDTVAGQDLVVFHTSGTSSALDARDISQGQDVGATGVFDRVLDGQTLTFQKEGDVFVDEQTASEWNILGQATRGPLAGEELQPIVHGDHFWFAWAAFKPDTVIYDANGNGNS